MILSDSAQVLLIGEIYNRGARKLYDMQVRVQKLILEVVPKYSAASGRRVETS